MTGVQTCALPISLNACIDVINFQQRYDIDARIQRALKRSKKYLEPLPAGAAPHNTVDDHVEWLKSRPGYKPEMETEYRDA